MLRTTRRKIKLLFAAHTFVYTSKDGMVIADIVKVSPYRLYRWYLSPAWDQALKFWDYTGDPEIQGDEYQNTVQNTLVRKSLNAARRLWFELFGIKPLKDLEGFLQYFDTGDHENTDTEL